MYYVLSLVDWEEYCPVWFESNLSKKQFKEAVRKVAKFMTEKALANPETGYICGRMVIDDHDEEILNTLQQKMLERGFKMIKPDLEVTVMGSSIFDEHDKNTDIYSKKDWQKILEHNEKIHNRSKEEWEEIHRVSEQNKMAEGKK